MRRTGWKLRVVLIGLAMSYAGGPARGAGSAPSSACATWPGAQAQIDAVLGRAGLGESVPQELPCELAARIAEAPSLEVEKAWRDAGHGTVQVRVRCESVASCLPFVITVKESPRAERDSLNPPTKDRIAAALSPARRPAKATALLVRSGQKVWLLWERGNLRLTRTMVCLDSGREGQAVRTRSREGGPVVMARVISAGWVRVRE